MILSSAYILMTVLTSCACVRVRVVTWNVNDNSKMKDGFTSQAIDKVLDLGDKTLVDMYAIGLQEQCWKCNEATFGVIGAKFLDRIHRYSDGKKYKLIHVEGEVFLPSQLHL